MDAQDFCRKVSERIGGDLRLPSEAQWEYACRNGSPKWFYFGDTANDLDRIGWRYHNTLKTHPVGTLEANGFGVYDIYGNVWEWCQDWYGQYMSESLTDPQNLRDGLFRVLRGDSDDYCVLEYFRSSFRYFSDPTNRGDFFGFRCAKTP